jgi:hypothetical protein
MCENKKGKENKNKKWSNVRVERRKKGERKVGLQIQEETWNGRI